MVSILTFYSDNPSWNPAEANSFSVKFVFEKNQNRQNEVAVGPFKKLYKGGSPGLVVMGGDSCSEGRGFESWRHIQDGHDIFHIDFL